jgi:hypothetical protein
MYQHLSFTLFKRCLLYLLIIVAAAGCATIKLVGDYDEQIDKGTTAFQKDVETFLVKLEASAEKPEDKVAAYADNKQFYADARVTLSGLRLRADAIERNSLTVRALDKLGANIDMLEDMHKAGITRVEVSKLIRPGFTQQFTAILTFELAKKRGEKPDEAKILTAPTQNTATAGANK